jgi:hypothetical protein
VHCKPRIGRTSKRGIFSPKKCDAYQARIQGPCIHAIFPEETNNKAGYTRAGARAVLGPNRRERGLIYPQTLGGNQYLHCIPSFLEGWEDFRGCHSASTSEFTWGQLESTRVLRPLRCLVDADSQGFRTRLTRDVHKVIRNVPSSRPLSPATIVSDRF